MKELNQLSRFAHHTSLDRIENLKITINLFKKGETVELVDTLEAKWQQLITKDEISARKAIELSSPGTSKKKSRKESKLKSLKRCIYTNVDANSEIDRVTNQFTEINIAKDFMRDLKTSNGLERNLDSKSSKQLSSEDVDVLGIPREDGHSRWRETANPLTYSEMHFFACLPKPVSTEESAVLEDDIEYLLCSIYYYGNGNYALSHNFTTESNPHHFKIGDEVYEYTIENSSITLSPENERKERLIFEEFFKRQNRSRLEKLPKEFQFIPDTYMHRIHYMGEIISGHSFNADLLYCQYLFSIPSEWKNDIGVTNLISASTQVSYAITSDNKRISYFGCPIDLQLLCGADEPKPPKLYIKVMSVDGEDRHAVEGYGTVILPNEVGVHHLELKTWKPIPPRRNELKTFFLGGSPELGELNFNDVEGRKVINRYGFQTESSGIISVKVHILRQIDCTELRNMAGIEQERSIVGGSHDALEKAKMRLAVLKQLDESPLAA